MFYTPYMCFLCVERKVHTLYIIRIVQKGNSESDVGQQILDIQNHGV